MLPWARLAAVALAVAGLTWSVLHYFNPAQVGGVSAPGGGNVFSLSSGLALAAVIVWGPQTLLAVWLGSLVGGQLLGFSLLDSLATPLGAAVGAWLVRRHPAFDARLPDLSDLLRLLAAGALGALASAAVGSTALLVRNAIGPDALWQNLRDGWMGDLLGVLLLTPLALLWWSASGRPWLAEVRKKWPECLLLAGLLLWVTGEVFLGWGLLQRLGWSESLLASITRADWLFPLIALVAVRLGRRATALALLLMALAGYAGTYQGLGVLATNGSSRLLSFWFFFMNLSLLGLLLAWHVHASQRLRQQLMQHSASANKELLNIHKALNLHTAVAILDARGHFSSVNAVFCRTCGYPADELIGRLPQAVLAADDTDAALYQQVARQMQAGQDWEGEFANRAKDGHRFWWATSILPILGDDGRPAMFVVLATDISSRKLSEQLVRDYQQDLEAQVRHKTEYLQQAIDTLFISEARYRFLLDESSDPIFSFSPDIRYTYANAAFASPIGKTPQQVIGCTPHEVMPAVDADKRVAGVRSVFERGQEIVSEVRVSTATGERYYLTTAKPVVNLLQQVVMVLCVSKDITHIRQTRAELQSALNLLGATLEATEQGIIVMDTHDKLKLWNRRFLDLWGLQPEWLQMDDLVLVRQQMASLLIDPGQMAHLAHLADAGAATDRFATVLLRFTDGRVIKRSSQPQKLGEQVVGRVWSYTDITELEQQKEALRDSETRFSLAVDGADQGIWDIHLSTGEMYHSPRMAGMLGYTQAELPPLLAAWEARIAPDMAAGFRAAFNAHLKNPTQPFEYVLPLRHRDGSVRSIQSRGRASLDAAGRAVRATGTHTDITERLQAEQRLNETLALLNTTLAATDEGIIVVSTQDHLDLWNQRFVALWGIDEAFLQRQDIVAIRQQMATRTNDPLTYTASLTALYLQPQASTFDLLKMADGRVLRRVSHPQRMGGAVTGRVWSYADVTDLKRAEDSARAADLAKSEFLANMSHEIRTPMNGVVGMVDILQQTALSDEQRRMLEVVQCSAQDLLGILNDILDFAKIEAGKLALEPRATELHPLVSSAIQLMQPNASSQGVTLHSAIAAALPRWVLTDPTRLRQVLLNLLGNAIKFTADVIKRERQVSLTVQPVALADGAPGLQFCVADNGIGMDDEVVARLFAPFMQADASTARRFGGTGLGLSISQRLVTLLGGQIAVRSRLGEGATFTVTLPLQPARMPLPDAPTPLLPASGAVALLSLHILLAEDNPINVDVISQQLRLLGCHCSVALDGAQALTLWQAGHFDLLLTDCHMPVMDGFALARAIRQQEPPGTRLPIIAITANAMKGEAERCFAAGMDAYLTKPIRLHELAAQLARYPQARLPDAALPAPPNAALLDTAPPGRTHPGLAATVVAASVTPAATATASAPVVWRAETLGELVGPDLALQKRLLQKFLLAAGGHIDAILAATQAGQWGVAAGTAHTLKSAARSVGALQLGELCQHIETSGHAGLDTECQHATQQLSAVFEAARQCIAPLLD